MLVTKVEQNGLICCDPYFEKEDQRLPLTLFYKGLQEVLYLYQQEYDMPAGEVSEILLPINPSIHIFAITIV